MCLFVAELGVDGLSVRACVEPVFPGWLRGGRARAVHAQHGLLSPRGGRLRSALPSPEVPVTCVLAVQLMQFSTLLPPPRVGDILT